MLWYLLEAPQRGTSNEYHMFSMRNKENYWYFSVDKKYENHMT